MIVCLCLGISDRDIRAAVARGARHSNDVFGHQESSPCCGSCVDSMDDLIAEASAKETT